MCDLLLERLCACRDKLSSEELSQALQGLARLGIRLPPGLEQSFLDALPRLLPKMDDQQVASSLWALGKVGVVWTSLGKNIKRAIGRAVRGVTQLNPAIVPTTPFYRIV